MATAPKAVPKAVPKSDDTADAVSAPKKSKLKLIVIALVLLLAIGGGAGYFLLGKKAPAGAAEAKHEAPKAPVFANLEPFTVNLQQEAAEQFLQVSITVQVSDEKAMEEIKLYMPQVRNRILLLLSSKKASEINTADGKKKLAEEIAAQIRAPFSKQAKPQEVDNVFFTSFVIQ
jgi:flagellar FliL protein